MLATRPDLDDATVPVMPKKKSQAPVRNLMEPPPVPSDLQADKSSADAVAQPTDTSETATEDPAGSPLPAAGSVSPTAASEENQDSSASTTTWLNRVETRLNRAAVDSPPDSPREDVPLAASVPPIAAPAEAAALVGASAPPTAAPFQAVQRAVAPAEALPETSEVSAAAAALPPRDTPAAQERAERRDAEAPVPGQRAAPNVPEVYAGCELPQPFATRLHMGAPRAPVLFSARPPGALQRGGYLWGVPRDAVEQRAGAWSVRPGYLTSLIMQSPPAGGSRHARAHAPPAQRRTALTARGRSAGFAALPADPLAAEVAEKLAHLTHLRCILRVPAARGPRQAPEASASPRVPARRRHVLPPAPPAPSSAPAPETEDLRTRFDRHFAAETRKGRHAEQPAPAPPPPTPAEVPPPALSAAALAAAERELRAAEAAAPGARLVLAPRGTVRVCALDRSGEFAAIVERVDELERLVRPAPRTQRTPHTALCWPLVFLPLEPLR